MKLSKFSVVGLIAFVFVILIGCVDLTGDTNSSTTVFIGQLDTSFNGTGQATIGNRTIYTVKEAKDGGILVAGESFVDGQEGAYIAKLRIDGQLDNSFGNNGVVTLGNALSDENTYPRSLTVLANGEILLAGDYDKNPENRRYLFIAKFNEDGQLDENFGGDASEGGTLGGGFGFTGNSGYETYLYELAVLPDGKIVVVVQNDLNNFIRLHSFNSSGLLVNSFGNRDTESPGYSEPWESTITFDHGQPDDDFVTSFFSGDANGYWLGYLRNNRPAITRLTSLGHPDTTIFSPEGFTGIPDNTAAATTEPYLSLNLAGTSLWTGIVAIDGSRIPKISRYGLDGSLLSTLTETNSVNSADIEHTSESIYISGLAPLANDGLAVLFSDDGPIGGPASARTWLSFHAANATRNTTIGDNGSLVLEAIGSSFTYPDSMLRHSSGRLIVVGKNTDGTDNEGWVALIH